MYTHTQKSYKSEFYDMQIVSFKEEKVIGRKRGGKVTLQYGHQPRADARNDVTQKPLLYLVCWQPRRYGEQGQGDFLGLLRGAAENIESHKSVN